jgi:hypothetical protein
MLDLACKRMWKARIGAIIHPGYVLQHLLSDDGKGGALFLFDGMVERVAIVAGNGYYEVRRENRQVKISPDIHSASTDPGQSHEVMEETSVQRLQSNDSDVLRRREVGLGWGRYLEGLGRRTQRVRGME